ncbi:MAG: hypothetical protein IKN04_14825 [Clostridia bacterium]|nr:hypothetical protein [Clostridia bacterium]
MRKLASIKTISSISPIEGKDRIVLAAVDGWQVIVQKSDFNPGDKCVYVEIDSVMPERPEFEFLRKRDFRIRTMKMAGVISQGICFPISILPPKKNGEYELEEDVTEILGVTQYEATMDTDPEPQSETNSKARKYPAFLMRFKWFRRLVLPKSRSKGFPDFISKTDEIRIQNIPQIVLDKRPWIATEKVDGQSGTFALVRIKSKLPFVKDKFEYIVCSRNLRLGKKDNSSYWRVSDKYNIENALRNMIGDRPWIAIQGECIAPKVQGNKYKVTEPDLFVFNLIYPTGRVDSIRAKSIIEQHGMNFVPIIATDYVLPDSVEEVLQYATGKSVLADTLREGIVFRSQDGSRSFKAVSNEFLLAYNE